MAFEDFRGSFESARRLLDAAKPQTRGDVWSTINHLLDAVLALSGEFPARRAVDSVSSEVSAVPDPRVDAFERICILLGAAGFTDLIAEDLLREVGNICASVHGVPNPNSGDTARGYSAEVDRLTRAQRRLVGGAS